MLAVIVACLLWVAVSGPDVFSCDHSPPQPHVIVHCAAERRPDVVERHTEAAMNLNIHASATLAKESGACEQTAAFSSCRRLVTHLFRRPPGGHCVIY